MSISTYRISLTGHFDGFVNQLVTSGRYSDASQVLRAGLQLLEEQEKDEGAKSTTLRALAEEAFGQLDRGEGIVLESQQELEDFISQAGRRVAETAERPATGG